jgi:predicted nucleotidyltransferase
MSTTAIDYGALAAICMGHHIRRLALFGSALRDDLGPDSDIDLLAEFAPGHTPGLAFFAIQEKFAELMGRRVDLNTPGFLSPYFRAEVLQIARDLYVEA